jgi:hypothetical protein
LQRCEKAVNEWNLFFPYSKYQFNKKPLLTPSYATSCNNKCVRKLMNSFDKKEEISLNQNINITGPWRCRT